ncbi:MAG: FAD-binding protein, partial [Rikenellaceae bacterium]
MKNLKLYNTFGIDVCCSRYVEFNDVAELSDDMFRGSRWYVLGGGSNTLFSSDFDGVILHPVSSGISIVENGRDHVLVRAEAGVVWDDFVSFAVENGFYGAENLSWIPGSVGASPVQNIGAYGSEAKDIIHAVEYYNTDSKQVEIIGAEKCQFGYRDSIFKNSLAGRVVVNSVIYRLSKTFVPNIRYGNICAELDSAVELTAKIVRETVIKIRKAKLPDPAVIGNGGSFFKNP